MSVNNVDEFMQEVNKMWVNEIKEWLALNYISSPKIATNNGSNAISLREYVETLKEAYLSFKEEYEAINVLNLGEGCMFDTIIKDKRFDGEKIVISIKKNQSNNSIVPWNFNCDLIISKRKDDYKAFFTRGTLTYDINIDSNILKAYFDVFKKYYSLFRLYRFLNTIITVGNNREMRVSLDMHNGSLLEGLDGINIALYEKENDHYRYYVNTFVDLTDEVKIDYDKCLVKFKKNNVQVDNNYLFDNILDLLYVDVDELNYQAVSELARKDSKIR